MNNNFLKTEVCECGFDGAGSSTVCTVHENFPGISRMHFRRNLLKDYTYEDDKVENNTHISSEVSYKLVKVY